MLNDNILNVTLCSPKPDPFKTPFRQLRNNPNISLARLTTSKRRHDPLIPIIYLTTQHPLRNTSYASQDRSG